MVKNQLGITISKSEDIVEWYQQVILKSEMADYSAVKGCPVIRPWGYALWNHIQTYFNSRLESLEVENAYFPIFIPENLINKEADHVEGFAPELAWVQRSDEGERVAVRPTSEAIICERFSKWIRSHRDLPIQINQWANVVRWEVSDVKLFLRGREFLWQEGHCVYATNEEADGNALQMIEEYKKLSEELLAVPAVIGLKSECEKFPGAKQTYTIESFMPDGKALQAGTSHNLGQGFAKSFDITYKGQDEQDHYPYQTSWGFSTRLLGSMVMMHSDDKGLVLPPLVAPKQIVIIPISNKKNPEAAELVTRKANELRQELLSQGFRVTLDDRPGYAPGHKYGHWELKGVPIRLELGPRDLEKNQVIMATRIFEKKESIALTDVPSYMRKTLSLIQDTLLEKARKQMQSKEITTNSYDELKQATMHEGKYVLAPHCAQTECEKAIKEETGGVTTRCRPLNADTTTQSCIRCSSTAKYTIYFSRNY